MNLFRLNPNQSETSGRRLFRPIRGEPRRFVLVRGQVSPPPAAPTWTTSQNQRQDPESLAKESPIQTTRNCNPCLLGGFISCMILALIFLAFSIMALVTFFYRSDKTTAEKWEFLTG